MKAPDKIIMNECLFSDIGILGVEEEVEYVRKDVIKKIIEKLKSRRDDFLYASCDKYDMGLADGLDLAIKILEE